MISTEITKYSDKMLKAMKLCQKSQPEIIGLDIGSFAVKAVKLKNTGKGYEVVSAAIKQINPDQAGNEKQPAYDEIKTAKAVTDCISELGTEANLAVCGISGAEVAVRDFSFPLLPSDEIEGAVKFEAAQVCPFNIDDCEVDYQLLSRGNGKMTGILVTATNALIDEKKMMAKNASVKPALIDIDGLALLNCLRIRAPGQLDGSASEVHGTTAILNIGYSYTNLAIMGVDGLPYIRDVAHAGKKILEVMERGEVLAHALSDLLEDVSESLRYYKTQKKSMGVKRILVCGGASLQDGLVDVLSSQLEPFVELWNPFTSLQSRCIGTQKLGSETIQMLQKNGPAFAVAAGLGMRNLTQRKQIVNGN